MMPNEPTPILSAEHKNPQARVNAYQEQIDCIRNAKAQLWMIERLDGDLDKELVAEVDDLLCIARLSLGLMLSLFEGAVNV